MESDLTIDSELISTPHDRLRREERNIDKSELQRARRYGMVENGRWRGSKRYTHAGKVFVYDEKRNKAITSWQIKGGYGKKKKSGTSAVNPIMLPKSKEHDNSKAINAHNRVKNLLMSEKKLWKSHSVLVVDMSGSMREDDVNGARCRSDGVWMVLARDFIKKQLDERTASIFDLVSIVLMGDSAETFCCFEPIDWVLYNMLVDLREWTTVKPSGAGNYIPALAQAEGLLDRNKYGSCSLSLLFFSDGRPSDQVSEIAKISLKMGEIASRFGRRLVVSCIGMANQEENFSILQSMAKEAMDFGCNASFSKPSLSTDSLSSIITTLTSSMTSTKTELTELRTGKLLSVRTDVTRERRNAPDDIAPTEDWRVFLPTSTDMYTKAIYAWNRQVDDFVLVMDHRCLTCFDVVADMFYDIPNGKGSLCPRCKSCFFCSQCVAHSAMNTPHNCESRAHMKRNDLIVKRPVPSFGVAYKKHCFGEGAERMAFKFRFVDKTGNFVGPKMVAKESRFVEMTEGGSELESQYLLSSRHSYHRQFMRTQAIAARFAFIYNRALDEDLPKVIKSNRALLILKQYPRIRFLDPLVVELAEKDPTGQEVKTHNILVEPMIEDHYRKFNNNFGAVANEALQKGYQSEINTSGIDQKVINFLLGRRNNEIKSGDQAAANGDPSLGIIQEGSEEDDDSDDDDEEEEDDDDDDKEFGAGEAAGGDEVADDDVVDPKLQHNMNSVLGKRNVDDFIKDSSAVLLTEHFCKPIPDNYFAQAFSHFSYVRSGGRLMVVDLQGTLEIHADGSREFVFTDPAIHKKKNMFHRSFGRTLNLGRTDRGTAGMRAFWESHVCNDACRLLGLRPRQPRGRVQTEIFASNRS